MLTELYKKQLKLRTLENPYTCAVYMESILRVGLCFLIICVSQDV